MDFTGGGGKDYPITLTEVNPVDASCTTTTVAGLTGPVVGYAPHGDGTAFVAAGVGDDPDNPRAFQLASLDLRPAKATLAAVIQRGGDETSASYYAGYFRTVAGTECALRLGYQQVTVSAGAGVGVACANGTADFHRATASDPGAFAPLPSKDAGMYLTAHGDPTVGDFLSVSARRTGLFGGLSLSLVGWAPGRGARVVAELKGASPPRFLTGGTLGYVLAAYRTSDATHVSVVDHDSPLGELFDRWALAVVDVKNGASRVTPISPSLGEGERSISGVGMAA